MTPISLGDPCPDIALPRDGGGLWTLAEAAGKPLVIYFYPKDDTAGCTTEARDFTAAAAEFAALGATVVGVSKDSVAKHDKFRDKHDLGVILLSDEAGDVCERFGVWGEKTNYGRTYLGITRTTVLVGADGRIAAIWNKVRVKGHADEVLATVRAL